MTIDGGTFDGTGAGAVIVNGHYADSSVGSLTVKKGQFNGTVGIKDGGYGTGTTILVEGGDFDVSGDVFSFTGGEPDVSVSGGTFNKTFDSKYMAPGVTMAQNPDGTYGVVESITITFVDIDGTTLKQVDIPKGSSVPAEEIPAFGTAPENYAYHWNSEDVVDVYPDIDVFYTDTTLTAALHIEPFEITVEVSGNTATAVFDVPVDGCTVNGYLWFYVNGESFEDVGSDASVTLDRDGLYYVQVEVEDSEGIVGYGIGYTEYTAGSELPPFIPFPPEQGGDPVEVYPSGDSSSSSDDGDGTLKVVAVAAAAVIAAILAIVLASTYRKD